MTHPQVHSREDEIFHILEGEVTFTVAGQQHIAAAGTFVHAPRGIEHAFRNTGGRPARLLVWIRPAGLEAFFREVGEPLPRGTRTPVPVTPAHLEKVMEAAPRSGLEIRLPA